MELCSGSHRDLVACFALDPILWATPVTAPTISLVIATVIPLYLSVSSQCFKHAEHVPRFLF